MLARYNEVVPNGAERVVAMAESQLRHRQELEGAVVHGNVSAERPGQNYAFILGLIALTGGIGLIAFNKSAEGLAAIITAFASLAGVFIYGRWQQQREREQKRKEAREAAETPKLPFD